MSEYIGYKTPMFCQKLANGEDALVTVLTGEEVIRCRDCAYHTQEVRYESVQCYCEYFDFYAEDDNGFCAWAERRQT